MLQRIIVAIFILIVVSCATSRPDMNKGESISELYFKGNVVRHWEKGIDYLNDEPRQEYFKEIVLLYLNDKYLEIRYYLGLLINYYIDTYDIDFNILIEEMYSVERSVLLLQLSGEWQLVNVSRLAEKIYLSDTGDIRSFSVEYLGRNVLDYKHILYLFNNTEKRVQTGVISSAGYIIEDRVLKWLETRLLGSDEEIALASVFSISKHGNQGFDLLADNINQLSVRLKLTTIDLLTFNKVESVLKHYPQMLLSEEDLISERVLKSLEEFGKKADRAIIDSLRVVSDNIGIALLDILDSRGGTRYFREVIFLMDRPGVREKLISIYFKNNAKEIIKELLLSGDSSFEKAVIDHAVEIASDIIFYDDEIKVRSLYYFLNNLDFVTVFNYFVDVGFDDLFIDDYVLINSIYSALQKIEYMEKLNGLDSDVSKYFELEQNRFLAEKEAEDFYGGLEMWLETGDKKYLDQSVSIKKSNNPRYKSIQKEREDFFNSLSEERQAEFYDFEDSKLRVVYDFRQLTYRLKGFGEELITSRGFKDLIK